MLSEAKRALLTRFSRDGADCETLLVIQPFDRVRCAEGTVLVVAPGSIGVASSIIASSASSGATRDSISAGGSP